MTAQTRLGVCDPDERQVRAMVAQMAEKLTAEYGPVTVTGGVIERDTEAFALIREAAPKSPCWQLLDSHPDAVLVVAYAQVPVQ